MSERDSWPRFPAPALRLCPDCRAPMAAETLIADGRDQGAVWRCTGSCGRYLWRHYEYIAVPTQKARFPMKTGFAEDAPYEYWEFHCVFCDGLVEIVDGGYMVWNCPNCLLMRAGFPNVIKYDEAGDEVGRVYPYEWDPWKTDEDDEEDDGDE